MNELKGKRRAWWLAGVTVLILGFLAALLILPATAPTPGAAGPDIHVPKMQNVPPENAPMHLEPAQK